MISHVSEALDSVEEISSGPYLATALILVSEALDSVEVFFRQAQTLKSLYQLVSEALDSVEVRIPYFTPPYT